jgi:DNA-binding protein YbaB
MSMAGGYGSGRFDLGAMSDKLSWLADDLRRTGEQLRQAMDSAAERGYEAASPDGLVRVRVNGRCRVTGVKLSPHVSRQEPDTLDAVLTATLNDALRQARAGTQEALLEGLPARMRAGIEQTVDAARREAGQ